MQRRATLVELAALALCVGCQTTGDEGTRARAAASAEAKLSPLLEPPPAGRFQCEGGSCSQPYPRLPDTGEWRCADRDGVVWCAGGEPAAGVVPGVVDASYRCGVRFGDGPRERVCLDEHPDYPAGPAGAFRCSFAQERGSTRVCQETSPKAAKPLPPHALPACWLDKDCRAGECDRGTCRCAADQDCERGRCKLGVCAEGA